MLLRPVLSPYLCGMEIHFNAELESRLTRRVAENGCDSKDIVEDVVARYFAGEDRFVEAVKRGEAALERGDFLAHEQVGERLMRFLQP